MSPRHGLLRWGVATLLVLAGTLAFSGSALARTRATAVQALGGHCSAIIGHAEVEVMVPEWPYPVLLDIADRMTTRGKGRQLFSVSIDVLPEEPPLVQLTKLEHAACGKTPLESTFSADGLASVAGEPGYSIALTFRKYRKATYLTINLAKQGRKFLSFTNVEIEPSPYELIL